MIGELKKKTQNPQTKHNNLRVGKAFRKYDTNLRSHKGED